MPGPLTGYRVCDLSGQIAGAGATRVLAAVGAEVIRVEDPVRRGRWDILRNSGPVRGDQRGVDAGGGFNNLNVEKLGITLDLRDERGRDLLRALVARSDVVTSNFAAGVLDRLGFGYEEVRKLRPDVVYVTSSGFGETGPDRHHRVWGPIVQAVGGLSFEVGLPDQEPAAWGFSLMDFVAAHAMTMAVLAALIHRERTGEGQAIDLASTEAALTMLGPALADVAANGRPRRRPGSPNANRSEFVGMVPHGVYPVAGDDQWVAIACRHDDDWKCLAEAIVGEPWARDPRWSDSSGRRRHEDELDGCIAGWTANHERDEVVHLLRSVGIPVAPVARPQERIENDPDTTGFGLWPEVVHPVIGPIAVDGLPFHLSDDDWSITRPAPCLGEHTDQVLGELLGVGADELAALRADGVILVGPLEGVRVVELASEWTGVVGLLLAGMGASVTVVEPPEGSITRGFGPFLDDEPGPDRSLWWRQENRGKVGVRLDLDAEEGRAELLALLSEADVLVESEAPGRLSWLDLPSLVWASVTPFGRGSERADEAVTDLTLLAGAGPMWSCGYDDHTLPPQRGGEGQAAVLGGFPAVIGVLVALLARESTGRGQHVDVSIHAALNVTTEGATYEWFTRQATVQRQTGRHAWVSSTQPIQFLARDGRHVHTGMPTATRAGCRAVLDWLDETGGRDHFPDAVVLQLAADGELPLADPEMQAEVAGILRACTAHIARLVDADDFYRQGQARGLAVGVVNAAEDVLADPHLQARGAWEEIDEPGLGRTIRYPAAPVAFKGGRVPLGPAPPAPAP